MIKIYTDGSCKGNPGKGAWSFIIVKDGRGVNKRDVKHHYLGINEVVEKWHNRFKDDLNNHEVVGWGVDGELLSTNNKAELNAVVMALRCAKKLNIKDVELIADSDYVVNCINQDWISSWKKNGWLNSNKKDVANKELWEEIDNLNNMFNIKYTSVKSHSGVVFNEFVDAASSCYARNIK